MANNNYFESFDKYNENNDTKDRTSNKEIIQKTKTDKDNSNKHINKKLKKNTLKMLLITLALICIIFVSFIAIAKSGKQIPDFTGFTKNNALLWATENKISVHFQEQFSDYYAKDDVISQSISADEKIDRDTVLTLTVSKGVDLSVLVKKPSFTDMTKTEIEDWGKTNKLTALRITTEYSDTIEKGRTIRYEINDTSVLDEFRRDTPVYVIISKGTEDADKNLIITIPNFKDKHVYEIMEFAKVNDLNLTINEVYDNYTPAGVPIAQSIEEKAKVQRHSDLTVTVSKGKKILVPDLSDCTKENIMAVANNAGISVVTYDKYSSIDAGKVVSQSIHAGEVYKTGDIIEVYFSLGDEINMPTYVDDTLASIQEFVKGLNEKEANLNLDIKYSQSDKAKNIVIGQDKAGIIIKTGSTINVVISSGKKIVVPSFVDSKKSKYRHPIKRDAAIKTCSELGITPIFIAEKHPNRLPGEIWEQSIPEKTEIISGGTITLKYFPETIGNYIGLTKEEILENNDIRGLIIRYKTLENNVPGYNNVCSSQSLPENTVVLNGTRLIVYISPNP